MSDNKISAIANIYGTFHLDENEFAIPAYSLQEVVNHPPALVQVPLAPDHVLGVFNLRGVIIPVVDLSLLLGLTRAQSKSSEEKKVAIILHDDFLVGVVFERTGEVLRDDASKRSSYEYSENTKERVLAGAFKLDDGKRIVQILDINSLFSLEGLAFDAQKHTLAKRNGEDLNALKGKRRQAISFRAGNGSYALAMDSVREIVNCDLLDSSALSAGICVGCLNLRGSTVPVVDFDAYLGGGMRESSSELASYRGQKAMILSLGGDLIGLMVPAVDSIVSYFENELAAFPEMVPGRKGFILGCLLNGEGETMLLDAGKILSEDEISKITKGHSALFARGESSQEKAASQERRTYITFELRSDFAVEISEIREIIEFPEEYMTPPGMPPACIGMLSLRGELVPLLDGRMVYAMPTSEACAERKVLVFDHESSKFAVVVDAVNTIMRIPVTSKVRFNKLLCGASVGEAEQDIEEALMVTDENGSSKGLLLLKLERLAKRALIQAAA